jgi:hypothetical protein
MGNNVSLIILHNTATRGRVNIRAMRHKLPSQVLCICWLTGETKRGTKVGTLAKKSEKAFLGHEGLDFNVQPKRPILRKTPKG